VIFENFLSKYKSDVSCNEDVNASVDSWLQGTALIEFLKLFSGCSFNNGLYRIHSAEKIGYWSRIVTEAFPEFAERISCFGYDWLGRQFALDKERVEDGQPQVLMLEPGTGEVLEIPVNFLQFHESELVNYSNEALATEFYNSWLSSGKKAPNYEQCIAYQKPLYLGGLDTVENLEYSDLEVYWVLSGQLLEKIRGLPPGTKVTNVTLS